MSALLLGRCLDLLLHPVDDDPFVPDDRARSQLDLLGEGPVVHACIGERLAHVSHQNDQEKGEEVGNQCLEKRLVGLWRIDQPKNLVFAGVLDLDLFLRLDLRQMYDLYQDSE